MEINFVDLRAQYLSIKEDIDRAIAEVFTNSAYILGPSVKRFEEAFAEYCACREAVAVNSGTSALLLALKALGIGPGDEVITAANTFIATVAAIIEAGATPVLIDADPVTRLIDINRIEAAVTEKTRVIMPVHLYGLMADMDQINAIAERHDLLVLEDSAQAHGARLKDRPAGSYGIAGAFSFYPAKNLGAFGEAGAIVTSDHALARKIRRLRDHGSERKYFHDLFGYNARMDGIQGAVLGVKLRHLDAWNRRRNRIAAKYREELSGLPVTLPPELKHFYQVYHLFVIESDMRNELQQFLSRNGIPTLIHYPIPVHQQKAYTEAGMARNSFPVTEKLAQTILSLPMYPELRSDQIKYISGKIREFFGEEYQDTLVTEN
ncbi:MAG: DegT/DnrJ/EryC1/StrS family aminotransferase [Candidatus Zixiibacteriota bacterium]|nr:MAG: DegT/DnrJ/EryC1/StrS family aminotransferase [candidate division Zixibacteria bacterium]